MDRRCPACNQFKDVSLFRVTAWGTPARDCLVCEAIRKEKSYPRRVKSEWNQPKPAPKEWGGDVGVEVPKQFRGVDIDRIHYQRGAVRSKKVA